MGRRTVSARTRFEILKRDNFTCQYCGRKAPDVTLECDHIHPVSRGGSDDFDNLIAACWECNSGKSDIPIMRVDPALDGEREECSDSLVEDIFLSVWRVVPDVDNQSVSEALFVVASRFLCTKFNCEQKDNLSVVDGEYLVGRCAMRSAELKAVGLINEAEKEWDEIRKWSASYRESGAIE